MNNLPSALLNVIPSGYFLAFERVLDHDGSPYCVEPVLVKIDPAICAGQQEVAYFYPGRFEEGLYQNPTKDTAQVEPLDDDFIDSLQRDSRITIHLINAMDSVKAVLDDPRPRIPFILPFK